MGIKHIPIAAGPRQEHRDAMLTHWDGDMMKLAMTSIVPSSVVETPLWEILYSATYFQWMVKILVLCSFHQYFFWVSSYFFCEFVVNDSKEEIFENVCNEHNPGLRGHSGGFRIFRNKGSPPIKGPVSFCQIQKKNNNAIEKSGIKYMRLEFKDPQVLAV